MFYNEDCIEGAEKHIPDKSADLIVTDPPFGIVKMRGMEHMYRRDESYVVDGYVEIPADIYPQFSNLWISEAARILRPGGSLYIVSGWSNLHYIINALHGTKLKEVNHIIWKRNFGIYTKKKFVSSHYHVLYWTKPRGKVTFNPECRFRRGEKDEKGKSKHYRDMEDVWIIPVQYRPGRDKNVNSLPDELVRKILQYSSNEGDTVVDFFCGAFTIPKIALEMGRKVVGFEISKNIYNKFVPWDVPLAAETFEETYYHGGTI